MHALTIRPRRTASVEDGLAAGASGTDRERLVLGHEWLGHVRQRLERSAFVTGDPAAGVVLHPGGSAPGQFGGLEERDGVDIPSGTERAFLSRSSWLADALVASGRSVGACSLAAVTPRGTAGQRSAHRRAAHCDGLRGLTVGPPP
jgi:hypothetical protein